MSDVKETGILMQQPLVIATKERAKDVTRRIRGKQMHYINQEPDEWERLIKEGDLFTFLHKKTHEEVKIRCPYGKRGDKLYVREAWKPVGWDMEGYVQVQFKADNMYHSVTNGAFPNDPDKEEAFYLKLGEKLTDAGCPEDDGWFTDIHEYLAFRSSMFLPKNLSRFWLRVISAYPERLQAITEADARREGVEDLETFEIVWDNINGEKPNATFDHNPWVWRIEYRLIS